MLSWSSLREDAAQNAELYALERGIERSSTRWHLSALWRHEHAEARAQTRYRYEHRHDDLPIIRVAPTPRAPGTVKMPTFGPHYLEYVNARQRAARRRRRSADL